MQPDITSTLDAAGLSGWAAAPLTAPLPASDKGPNFTLTADEEFAAHLVGKCFGHCSPEYIRFLRHLIEAVHGLPWINDCSSGLLPAGDPTQEQLLAELLRELKGMRRVLTEFDGVPPSAASAQLEQPGSSVRAGMVEAATNVGSASNAA